MASMIKGKIYKITSPNTDMVYIGSTTATLNRRLRNHFYDWERKRKYCSSIYIIEKGNVTIELLEEVQVDSKKDLRKLEQEWINKIPNAVNNRKAYIHEEQLKESTSEYNRKYREKNKEIIKKKHSEKKEYCKECNCWIIGSQMRRHERTLKHNKILFCHDKKAT